MAWDFLKVHQDESLLAKYIYAHTGITMDTDNTVVKVEGVLSRGEQGGGTSITVSTTNI